LHYFAWLETVALVSRIRDALRSGGLLLCRVNSTKDHNHGASGHPQIEPNFYMVSGERKRFFDEKSVLELFAAGWRRLSVEHFVTHKYAMPKALWEVVLERDAQPRVQAHPPVRAFYLANVGGGGPVNLILLGATRRLPR
jgi:hypothetical protein